MEYRDSRSLPTAYAALGFLMLGPLHGYDLHQRLSQGLGGLWRIAMSQLYSVLHKLVESGWAAVQVESQSGRPPRQTYAMTEEGRRAFWEWASAPVVHPRDLRVLFLAKIYFLRQLQPESIGDLIAAQRREMERVRVLLARRDRIESDDPVVGLAALEFRKSQTQSAMQWLDALESSLTSTREAG